ncbi:hypothetical protein CDL12_00631 [Handroanthus impetiginosus]|uniref:GTD-binding domain-containing protein n=1 Tax=Handroanthus impetiginosus TaxID=429701 RepID=A0A2G9IA23_9LAMI|nr:hypothetical protein CDL12_00631 [Handroanthus impetiginosus]
MRNKDTDQLPHVAYTKIKVNSDTESEGPFSDNESASALIREIETLAPASAAKRVSSEPQIINIADCTASEKLIHPAPAVKSLSESKDPTNTHRSVETKAPLGYGLEELNWQQADHKNDVNEPSELIPFPEALHSPNTNGARYDETQEPNATSTTELEKEVHVECAVASNLGSDSAGTAELWKDVTLECGETSRVGNESNPENEIKVNVKPTKTDTSSQTAESLDLGDAYKLALGTRGRQLSGRFLEQQKSMTDSIKASEDVKLLLSQLSAPRDMSPRVSANSEDFKAMDQIIPRRISLERNESSLSLDGSTISEIEGESVADRLKRQVEHDKKIIGTLYKELEEERNASAIAANQAMAMITRLQEEKAALHMEALQSIRMMEEQAEYDGEALQKANDLLTEREKQIQDLEYELELNRNQYGDVSLSGAFVTPTPRPESDAGELEVEKLGANYQESDMTAVSNSDYDQHDVNRTDEAPKILGGDINTGKISLVQFEDEKHHILRCLKILEEKLVMITKQEGYPGMRDGAFSTEEVLEASADQLDRMRASQENGGTEKDHLQRDTLLQTETPQDLPGLEDSQGESEAYGNFRSIRRASLDARLDAFGHELSVMSKKLEALEAEQNVMECSINSLEKGSEGFEFIQEIAVRLQELHSAHIRTRTEDLI